MSIQKPTTSETLASAGGQGIVGLISDIIDGIEIGANPGHTHTLSSGASNVTATASELNHLSGATSNIQTQLDAKQAIVSGVSSTEIGYLDGVTSAIQTQINTKASTESPTFTGTVTLPIGLTGVIRADSGVVSIDTDVTDLVSSSSTTLAGKVELATTAEAVTGTDTARAVTPEGLKAHTDAIVIKGMITNTSNGSYSFGGTNYIYPCDIASPNATETNRQTIVPACILQSLIFNITANTLNDNLVVTVRDDASNTALSNIVSAAETGALTVTTDVTVAANSLISIKIDTTAAGSGSVSIGSMALVYTIT